MSVKYLKNKSLCPLPFAGLYIEPGGDVKCCSISKQTLGNIHSNFFLVITWGSGARDFGLERRGENIRYGLGTLSQRRRPHNHRGQHAEIVFFVFGVTTRAAQVGGRCLLEIV